MYTVVGSLALLSPLIILYARTWPRGLIERVVSAAERSRNLAS